MSKSLNFGQSWTIDQLKQEQKSSFKVMSKSTGYWFICGSAKGHVSDQVNMNSVNPGDLLVSRVTNEDGETFLLLHNIGSGEAVVEW